MLQDDEHGELWKQVYELHYMIDYYSAKEHDLILNTTPSSPLVLPNPDELALTEEDMLASILSPRAAVHWPRMDDPVACSSQLTTSLTTQRK